MKLALALIALLVAGVGLDYYAGDSRVTAVHTASEHTRLQTSLLNTQGEKIGQAVLMQTEHGVLIHVDAKGLPAGWHALHIHEYGVCEAPKFESAGGHFNPDTKKHGYDNHKGFHAGDLPNVYVNESGELHVELFTDQVTLEANKANTLLRKGGTAIMIHEGADDYQTDPAGAAGARIACGVIGQSA